MAKKPTVVAAAKSNLNMSLLATIAKETEAGVIFYLGASDDAKALAGANPQLIEVNPGMTDPTDASKVAARLTDAGKVMLANSQSAAAGNPSAQEAPAASQSAFAIIANAELPKSKRRGGGGGAPVKYPFDQLEIGQSFFVPKSAEQPDPVKSLGSTISSANLRYAEETGTKQVTRTKRGPKNKAMLDAAGNKIKETATVPVYKYTRRFSIRPVEAGKTYGSWTAPSDGALIARVAVE